MRSGSVIARHTSYGCTENDRSTVIGFELTARLLRRWFLMLAYATLVVKLEAAGRTV
jgi:hypothetical protein